MLHSKNPDSKTLRLASLSDWRWLRSAIPVVPVIFVGVVIFCIETLAASLPLVTQKPPLPTLSAEQITKLELGDAILVQNEDASSAGAFVVQDIAAPPGIVWQHLLAFSKYKDVMDYMKQSTVYDSKPGQVKARFDVGAIGITMTYHSVYTIHQSQGWMTWTLDPQKKNDLDEVVGVCVVDPHPTKRGHSRTFFAVDMVFKSWVPDFLMAIGRRIGASKATGWVKHEAEKQVRQVPKR